jgi:hypothetical protein
VLKELFLCKDYLVSDEGYVLGKSGKKLKPSINPRGYQIINISDNGHVKGLSVHTAVMMTFNPDGKLDESYQVNHIDGNKLNNNIENLEWVTPKENMRHSVDVLGNNLRANNYHARSIYGINKKDKSIIEFDTLIDAGEYFNPDNAHSGQNTIWRALSGRKKSAYGYIWYYKT